MSKSKSRRQTAPQKKEEDANTVLEKLNMVEREVRTEEGQVYLMRTSPYRSEEDRINGVVITFIDITERKKAEQHIRESEARFRLFVMASTDTIYRMSADWSQMLLLNGEDFLEDADKPNARWLDQYIPEAEQVRVNAAIEEAIRSKGIFELEHRVKREDGSIGWTFSRAIPVLNNKNEIVEWFGAASDITAQKEAEGALHEHVDELTRFNRAMVSRESRMIELKKEVNDLRQKLGEPQAYPLEFEGDGGTSSAGAEQDCTEKEVNELRRRQGEPKTYPLDFEKEGRANEQELNKQAWICCEVHSIRSIRVRAKKHMSNEQDAYSARSNGFPSTSENTEELLRRQNAELERLVAELRVANKQNAESRRAALNMMEDAMLAEEAARESQQRATEILESIGDAFYAVDADFNFTYINRKAEEWWGRSRDSLIGRHYWTEFPQAIGSEAYHMHLKVFEERKPVQFETISPIVKSWIDVSIFPENRGGLACYFRDISERKRTEEALRFSQEHLASIFREAQVGLSEIDLSGRFLQVNQALCNMLGYSQEELVRLSVADVTKEEYIPVSLELTERLIQTGNPQSFDKQYRRKDGSYVWANSTLSLLQSAEDKPVILAVTANLTERKQAESALQESETRARTLADAIPHILWANDPQGKAIYFNKRWFEYTGLSEAESVGPGWYAIVHPDDKARSNEQWQQAFKSGTIFDTEFRLRHREGGYHWFIGRNVPLKDDKGRIAGWFGSATNIEDLKQAQEQLANSEERLRVTMESAVDYAIITLDVNNTIQGWSAGAERIFGFSEAEAKGQPGNIIFTPEDRAAYAPEEEIETAAVEGLAIDERWHMRKDGSRFFLSGVMRPIFNPRLSGFVKVARDMTQQRQAEERLRVWEDRYRIALQSAQMGAWDWYVTDDHLVWNDQQYLLLGLQPEHNQKNQAYFMQFIYKDDADMVRSALETALAEGSIFDEEFRIMPADTNEPRWMYGFGRAIEFEPDGRTSRMIGVMYDISERKRIEQQKDEFIGIASHELKTPVTSIKAYAEVLEDMFIEQGDKQSADLMHRMDRQIDRFTDLIRAMLDVTRISQGRLDIIKERLDLKALVAEVMEDMQLSTKHYLILEAEPIAEVLADRERIRQVFTNLLSNAIKYSPEAERVVVTIHPEGKGQVLVCVEDFGIGMTEEVSSKVFDRFYRGEEDLSHTYPGLGLGLYISAGIIRQHEGKIWARSKPGQGSTFCFTLPIAG